jgi:hypothetical protein
MQQRSRFHSVVSFILFYLCLTGQVFSSAGQITGATPCSNGARQSSEQSCLSGTQGKAVCKWQGNACVFNTATSLAFQKFPLEAATSTLFTAIFAGFNFWPTQLAYLQAERFATATNVNLNDPDGFPHALATMLASVEILLQQDEYFIILDGTRISTIYARDVIYGALEFIRSFVYVFNRGMFPPAYQQFQTVMYKVISFMENAIQIFVNEGFELVIELGQIVMDFAQLVLDPGNALTYLADVLHQIELIVSQALDAFKTFILSIPGLDQMCKWINELIGFINTIIGGLINDVIIPIINFVLGVVHTLEKFFQTAFSAVEHGLQDAIHFVEGLFNTIIGGIEKIIHEVIGGIEGIFSKIIGAYNDAVNFVNSIFNTISGVANTIDHILSKIFRRRRILGLESADDGNAAEALVAEALLYVSVDDLRKLTVTARKLVGHFNPEQDTNSIRAADLNHISVTQRALMSLSTIATDTSNKANFNPPPAPSVVAPPPSPTIDNGESPMQNLLVPFHIPEIQCSLVTQAPMIPTEPTPCVYDTDCIAPTAYCIQDNAAECTDGAWNNANVGGFNLNDLWDKPCPCTALNPPNSFCNVAAGFCQAGISPFGDPMSTCPAAGVNAFVDSSPYFNSLCFIIPVYTCAASGGLFSDGVPRTDAQIQSCVAGLVKAQQLSGPHLCRDFCSPSVFNIDNRLVQVGAPSICGCAIGWSVGGNQPLPSVSQNILANTGSGRRRVLANETMDDDALQLAPPHVWFVDTNSTRFMKNLTLFHSPLRENSSNLQASFCFNSSDCEHASTLCETARGVTTCATCPMRNFYNGPGHECTRSKCVCEAVPSSPLAIDFSKIHWEGTSDCALIGQAYGKLKNLSALQYTALRTCTHKHFVGALVGRALGMPTLSPRIMYDTGAQLRASAHVGMGVLVGTLLSNFSDDLMFEAFNVLRIDPGIAIPAARITQATVAKIYSLLPRSRSVATKLGRIWVRTAIAFKIMPTSKEIGQVSSMAKNATLQFIKSPIYAAGQQKMRQVYDDVANFQQEIQQKVEKAGAHRRLQSSSGLVGLTCPIFSTFLNDFQSASQVLATTLENNVPRAVCRFLHPAGDWGGCPSPSWYLPLSQPPPPPSPPHGMVTTPFPPPPSTTQTITGGKVVTGTIAKYLFKIIEKLTGIDVASKLSGFFSDTFNNFPALTKVQEETEKIVNTLQCHYATSVQCRTRSAADLLYNVFYLAFEAMIIITVLKIIKLGALSTIVTSLLFCSFPARVMNMTYKLQFGCSISYTPVIPVCLLSNIQDMIYLILPRHLPWPSPLVDSHARSTTLTPIVTGKPLAFTYLQPSDVYNCANLGFGDGTIETLYWLDYWLPGWQKYISSATVDTFLGISNIEQINYFANKPIHENLYRQCAILYSFSVIPIIMIAVLVVFFAIAIFHCLLLFIRYVLIAIRNFYEAGASAYIETRDTPEEE